MLKQKLNEILLVGGCDWSNASKSFHAGLAMILT